MEDPTEKSDKIFENVSVFILPDYLRVIYKNVVRGKWAFYSSYNFCSLRSHF